MRKKRVCIVGGGLSGLVLASLISGCKEHFEVVLLEKNSLLGGQAASWQDSDHDFVETGIRVLFHWYENMRWLYGKKIGAPLPLVNTPDDLRILDGKRKKIKVLTTGNSLWENVSGIWRLEDLTKKERGNFLWTILKILSVPYHDMEKFDPMSVTELFQHWKVAKSVQDVLSIAVVTIQGLPPASASAASFLKFMKIFYGMEKKDYQLSAVSFLELPTYDALIEPLETYIRGHGGIVTCASEVQKVIVENKMVKGVQANNEFLPADIVVSAVPAYKVPGLLPQEYRKFQISANLGCLVRSSVITMQFWFKNRVWPDYIGSVYISNRDGVLFDAVCDKSLHWRSIQKDSGGSIIQILIDAAEDLQAVSDGELVRQALADLSIYFPKCRETPLKKPPLILRLQETYTATKPGYWSKIPKSHETPIQNFYLAGDYTAGPYHYGMESAVVSALEVANAIFRQSNLPEEKIFRISFPLAIHALETLFARWLKPPS